MVLALGVLVAASVIAAGCGGSSSGEGGKIALLLPESKTSRYESHDRPEFEAKVEELCEECEVIYSNANQNASPAAVAGRSCAHPGRQVLVLDPVDASLAGAIVKKANQRRKCRWSATTA